MDLVNNPAHYQGEGMQAIEVIEAFNLDYHRGNAIKYILRCGKKGDPLVDIQKAIWYLDRYASLLEKQ